MQTVHLNTNNEPCEVELKIYTEGQQALRVVGLGGTRERYFDRNVVTVGNPTVLRFGCPVSPKQMKVQVAGGRAQIQAGLNNIDNDIQINPTVVEFCDMVKEFCQNYKQYPPNSHYRSRSGKYCIKHVPSIIGSGANKSTPARIHKTKHYIEVANDWFRDFTIPMRVFVLCHEFSHIYLNKNPLSEPEADLNGAKLYLSMGFPVIELVYSFTKIFGESPATHKRATLIINWLKENE